MTTLGAEWNFGVFMLATLWFFLYLIGQGHGMAQRNVQAVNQQREELRQVVGYSAADELEQLDQLRASGKPSDAGRCNSEDRGPVVPHAHDGPTVGFGQRERFVGTGGVVELTFTVVMEDQEPQ
jgi:hypothetical protein